MILLAASLVAAGWAILTASGAAVVIVAACGVVAFLAQSSLRFQVRATPDHLVVCSGGPVRRIPWSEVKGFGIDQRRGRVLYVELSGQRKKLLPIPEVRTGRTTPTEVRDALQRYWKTHRR
jgi:hypothetical protein